MEAIAKYDFKATADDELSFKRGDILKVSVDAHSNPSTTKTIQNKKRSNMWAQVILLPQLQSS
uniref:SH3 domain-containing protein n=1 Tax=Castor canadensis TaxID=51338 RepID=A0A8C0XBH2_CASCN